MNKAEKYTKAQEYLHEIGFYSAEYDEEDPMLKIMTDFAEKEAIEFLKWFSKQKYIFYDDGFFIPGEDKDELHTHEELYQLYLKPKIQR